MFQIRKREPSLLGVFTIYLCYASLAYLPVLIQRRFFWEDFTRQEYPIRDFCFTSLGLLHQLPFWNPYAWGWAPFLADPQVALWYPTNFLQIFVTRFLLPSATHLPVLVPEIATLLHLPLAALGMYLLANKKFNITVVAAIVAGFVYGFGTKIVAEQNHQMFLYQLALFPWNVYFLMRAWSSWKSTFLLAIVLGISYLAGHPEASLFVSFFLFLFTCYESALRWKEGHNLSLASRPLQHLLVAAVLAVGVSAIQAIPSYELSKFSARKSMSYSESNDATLKTYHFINFFVPKFLGDHAEENRPNEITYFKDGDSYHWESAYYWGVLPEIFAAFAILKLWKRKKHELQRADEEVPDPAARYARFTIWISLFALLYALGPAIYLNWLFWKFVPIFGQLRAPNRMLIIATLLGALYSGVGLELFLGLNSEERKASFKTLLWILLPFVGLGLLSVTGLLGAISFPGRHFVNQIPLLALPAFILALLTTALLYWICNKNTSSKFRIASCVALIVVDLFYIDVTWHRSAVNPQERIQIEASSSHLRELQSSWKTDHTKMLAVLDTSRLSNTGLDLVPGLGMYTRLPITHGADQFRLKHWNQMSLQSLLPMDSTPLRRMQLMGVAMVVRDTTEPVQYIENAFPYARLYHGWKIAQTDSETFRQLNQPAADYKDSVVLSETPRFDRSTQSQISPIELDKDALEWHFSENEVRFRVKSDLNSILVVTDLFYPDWKATIDGESAPIYRAFGSFRGIPVPAGEHIVSMFYDAAIFEYAGGISLFAVLIIIAGLLLSRKEAMKEGIDEIVIAPAEQ